jgi:threonine/homoserine/homoserine lactone efflux protein
MLPQLMFLSTGVLFGLSGGLTPGPLLTLVVSETLKHGIIAGVKVSLAPLVTDLPIVAVSIILLLELSNIQPLLGFISIGGAAFLVYLGIESVRFRGAEVSAVPSRSQSFKKGVIANFLNPNPYVFWFTIGAPTALKAGRVDTLCAVLFIGGFYLLLVGSKLAVAVLVGKSRRFLTSRHYVGAIRCLGIALIAFAVVFVLDALKYWGIL